MDGDERVQCLMCESTPLSREKLLEHIYEHLNYNRHGCNQCLFTCSSLQDIMRHGDDHRHTTKIFGFRREYMDRVSEIIYKDCLDAQRRGLSAVMKCSVMRGDEQYSPPSIRLPPPQPPPPLPPPATTSDSDAVDHSGDNTPPARTATTTPKKTKRKENALLLGLFPELKKEDGSLRRRKCRQCKERVADVTERLKRHASSHLTDSIWRCQYCQYRTTANFARLETHVARKHTDRPPIDVCQTVDADQLDRIVRKCFPKKKQQSTAARSADRLEAELAMLPGTISSTSAPFDIGSVEEETGSVNSVDHHKIFCNECGSLVSSIYAAKRSHVAIKHLFCEKTSEIDEKDALFTQMFISCFPGTLPGALTELQCVLCQKNVSSETGRQSHAARAHLQTTLSCPHSKCSFDASHPADVARHMKAEHANCPLSTQNQRRWDCSRKTFQAKLLPLVHQCFPLPLRDKEARSIGQHSPMRIEPRSTTDSAMQHLTNEVRNALSESSFSPPVVVPPTLQPPPRRRHQSESAAAVILDSELPVFDNPPDRPSGISAEVYEEEDSKRSFLDAAIQINDGDGIEVTGERVAKRKRVSDDSRNEKISMKTSNSTPKSIPIVITTEESARMTTPLRFSRVPPSPRALLAIDTSKPPPQIWRHHRPTLLPSPSESKFDRRGETPSHLASAKLPPSQSFRPPASAHGSFPRREHQHTTTTTYHRNNNANDNRRRSHSQQSFGRLLLDSVPPVRCIPTEDWRNKPRWLPSSRADTVRDFSRRILCRMCHGRFLKEDMKQHLLSKHNVSSINVIN